MEKHKILGQRGENLARQYLLARGYEIIATNYRVGRLEIDLIAKKNKQYIFLEIKTRNKKIIYHRDSYLSKRQANNIKRALMVYAYQKRLNLEAVRFDLIMIIVDVQTNLASLRHYQNIF